MKKFILAAVVVACIGILVVGNMYWKNQVEETTAQAYEQLGLERPDIKKSSMSTKNNETVEAETDTPSPPPSANEQISEERSTNPEQQLSASANTSQHDSGGQEKATEQKSLVEIKRAYYDSFGELQAIQEGNANRIIAEAKGDYEKVLAGEMNSGDFEQKYLARADELERQTDQKFHAIFQQLQQELEANNYSKAEANEFQFAYQTKKEEYQGRVLRELSRLQ